MEAHICVDMIDVVKAEEVVDANWTGGNDGVSPRDCVELIYQELATSESSLQASEDERSN